MSGHEEKDPFGETRSPEDLLGPLESEPTAVLPPVDAEATVQFDPGRFDTARFEPGQYGAEQYNAAPFGSAQGAYGPGFAPPPPQSDFDDYSTATPAGPARWRGKTRSAVVFGAVAVLAAGLGVGLYAATQSSGGTPAAAPAVSTSANPSAGPSKGAKNAKALTARLTVTAVGTDSFTGKTENGTALTVRIAKGTKFGTAARPFTRAQLVPGADVYVRLRHGANGDEIAAVIAAGEAHKPSSSAAATPSAGA